MTTNPAATNPAQNTAKIVPQSITVIVSNYLCNVKKGGEGVKRSPRDYQVNA